MSAEYSEIAPSLEQILKPPPRTLIIIGGNAQERVLASISRLNTPVSIAPLATDYRDESINAYKYDLEITEGGIIDEPYKLVKKQPEIQLLFLPGGDQEKFMSQIEQEGIEAIRSIYQKGIIIAGTSAGAMVMGEDVILGTRHNFDIFAGLGLAPNFIIDTHFEERNREGRLLSAIQERAILRQEQVIGLGISENTGVILRNEKYIRVIGEKNVHLYIANSQIHHFVLSAGNQFTLTFE